MFSYKMAVITQANWGGMQPSHDEVLSFPEQRIFLCGWLQ